MIRCQFFKTSIILITLIRQTFSCNSTILDDCLIFQDSQITDLDISGQSSYGFGFWFQYLSTNAIQYYTQISSANLKGLLLLREYNPDNKDQRILFYQNWVKETKDLEKTLYFIYGNFQEVANFTYDSYKFDGKWIFTYISYQFPYKIQILLYDIQLDQMQGIVYNSKNDLTLTKTQIVLRGSTHIKSPIDGADNFLSEYPGRISKIQVNPNKDDAILTTTNQFKDYVSNQLLPKEFCELQTFYQTIVDNYKYQYGFIQLESWIKIDYNLNINYSASVFGIDLYFLPIDKYYQKLFDLQYSITQAWNKDKQNSIYFQTYYQRDPEFVLSTNQYFFDEAQFQVLKQDLREWHYVSMLYGADTNLASYQKLKMWFNDGFVYNLEYTNRTFSIFGQIIKVRSASIYGQASNGMTITTQSRITLCIPNLIDPIKKCHSSCQDCVGPYFNQCISCYPNSNRYIENFYCKCNLGYIESNSGECILLKELYINSIQEFNSKDQNFSQYGYFPIKTINNETIYQPCPKYHQNQKNKVICIECLSNPELFSKQLRCISDYILNEYGQYEQVLRSLNDIELYYYDVWKSSITLCTGCLSYCNPEIDQNCYLHQKIQLYITCQPNSYHYQGECKACNPICFTCNNYSVCTSCSDQMALNPETNQCLQCPKECVQCNFNNKLTCTKCQEKYTLFQGQCYPCGQNCQECFYTQDQKGYYNRCIRCLDDNKYYIQLNAVDCKENLDTQCQYVIQYHKTWFLRRSLNTLYHMFQRTDISSDNVANYCALCSEGYASLINGQCGKISSISDPAASSIINEKYRICTHMYMLEDFKNFDFQKNYYYCFTHILKNVIASKDFSSSQGCQYTKQNCVFCLNELCLQCYPGFYPYLLTGECLSCPPELNCYRCEQRSKKWKNGWKMWYALVHKFYAKSIFYEDVFGNEKIDSLEIVCKTCTIDYEFYQDRCIQKCQDNCELCIKVNGENKCVKCKVYEGRRLSLFEGKCIECPRYCQICKPKTDEQLQSTNPYFLNQNLISSTHTCLMLQESLNSQDYYYNTNFQQFFKVSTTKTDPNTITLQFNLYCNLEFFDYQLQISQDKEKFLNQNVKIDELLTQDKLISNLIKIENLNLYIYLSTQQIQEVELQFYLMQDCVIDKHSYIFTTLTQNIYFVNSVQFSFFGGGYTLHLNSNLELFNFNKISLSNFTLIPKQNTFIKMQSLNTLEVILSRIIIQQQNQGIPIKFNLQFSNLQQLKVNQLQLLDLNIDSVASFFKLDYTVKPENIQIHIDNFTIQNSLVYNSNIIFLDDYSQLESNCQFSNLQIINSNLTKSQFLTTVKNQNLNIIGSISQLVIKSSTFLDIQPLFLTQFIKNLTIQEILLQSSTFYNTTLLQASLEQHNSNYFINQCNFYQSSVLVSTSDMQFQHISFNRVEFVNLFYDQYTILFNLASQNIKCKVIVSNIILNTVTLLKNISLTQSFSSISSLLIIDSEIIQISNVKIIRSQGFSEFQLLSATNLILQNITLTLNQNYFQQFIISDSLCSDYKQTSKYSIALHIWKIKNIIIKDVSISNLIVTDMPLIYIISINTQIIKRSESIKIENIAMENCLILASQFGNQISGILISSEQQITINIGNSIFQNNIYYSSFKESESQSALILAVDAQFANIQIFDCKLIQNYISSSQNSLIYVKSQQILIIQSQFKLNNRIPENFLQHVNWKFNPQNLTLDYIESYFASISQSGNGYLEATQIQIRDTILEDSFAVQAGCFKLMIQNEGEILIKSSIFQNISTQFSQVQSFGGCLYIIDRSISAQLKIQDSIFNTILGTAEGGIFYAQPNTQSMNFNLTNVTIIDVYSNDGNIAKLNLLNYQQQFYMLDCLIIQTAQGYLKFKSKSSSTSQYETSMISIQYGYIVLINIFAKLYLNILLQLQYQNKISLTSIEIDDSFYYQQPIIQISFSEDQTSKLQINGIIMKNVGFYKEDTNFNKISIEVLNQPQTKLISNCQNLLPLTQYQSPTKKLYLKDLTFDKNPLIDSLVKITDIKTKDEISIKQSQFSKNQCINCQQGIILIRLIEQQSTNIQFQNIWFMDNSCGVNGCLYFIQDSSEQGQVKFIYTIDTMFCYRNNANKGGCLASKGVGLKIINSIFSENVATEQGGVIYYDGDSTNLQLLNNMIISNKAQEAGAIYLGNHSLPELNKTQNYLHNNTALKYGNTTTSRPSHLTLLYKNVQFPTFEVQSSHQINSYLTEEPDSTTEYILKLPSGQQLSSYQLFNLTNQEYQKMNIKFRIIALDLYNEQQYNQNNTQCKIKSGYKVGNQDIIYTNNYTNYNTKLFDQQSQDYNFDDLILYFGNDSQDRQLILQLNCDSVLISIQDDQYPFTIVNYTSNYNLYLSITTYPCQLGEYKNMTDSACYLCDTEKKQYSVNHNATTCKYMNEANTLSIRPAQLQLKPGYWRPFIDSGVIESCSNKIENCLGGWKQGDQTCIQGQIGACCESCDYYNIKGDGHYSLKKLYQCQQCENQGSQIVYILLITFWNLFSIYLTTQGVSKMIFELQRNKVGTKQLIINNNKQTGPIIKMFMNYLQIVSIILNFNVELPQSLKDTSNLVGNSQALLLISTDCFLAENFQSGLIYAKIFFSIICPILYGIIYLVVYSMLKIFDKIVFNQVVITTCILYLFCYFQIQVIQLLISSLSYRTLSEIKWIQADLSYQFQSDQHQQWIPYLIFLIITIGGVVPCILVTCLKINKEKLQRFDIRKQWGYLFLEYQPKAYYWEAIRIISREMIIIAITYFQDDLIIKCSLLFVIIFAYFYASYTATPFQTKMLNLLEQRSYQLCTVTLLAVFSMSQSTQLQIIVLIIILLPNLYLVQHFVAAIIKGYINSYESLIDKVKDYLKEKFKLQIKYNVHIEKWLENKGNRRKIVMQRFQIVKKYLYVTNQSLKRIEKQKYSKISLYNDQYNMTLFRTQQLFSTNIENSRINDPINKLIV